MQPTIPLCLQERRWNNRPTGLFDYRYSAFNNYTLYSFADYPKAGEEAMANRKAASQGLVRGTCTAADGRWERRYVQSFSVERKLEAHGGCVNALGFNHDGSLLADGSDDTELHVYRTVDWSTLAKHSTAHMANIFSAAFVPDHEETIVTTGLDGCMCTLNTETGTKERVFRFPASRAFISKATFQPGSGGNRVYLACNAPVFVSVDRREQDVRPYKMPDGVHGCTVISPDPNNEHLLCVGGDCCGFFLFDTRRLTKCMEGIRLPPKGSCIGERRAPPDSFGTNDPRKANRFSEVKVVAMQFSQDGRSMLINTQEDDVFELTNWDVLSGRVSRTMTGAATTASQTPSKSRSRRSTSSSRARDDDDDDDEEEEDGSQASSDGDDEGDGPNPRLSVSSPSSYDEEEEEDDDDEGEDDGDLVYFRRYGGRRNVQTMFKEAAYFLGDRYVVTGADDGNLYFWNRATGETVHKCKGDNDIINGVVTHPNLPNIVTCGIDSTTKVWTSNGNLGEEAIASEELFSGGAFGTMFQGGDSDDEWDDDDTTTDDDDEGDDDDEEEEEEEEDEDEEEFEAAFADDEEGFRFVFDNSAEEEGSHGDDEAEEAQEESSSKGEEVADE